MSSKKLKSEFFVRVLEGAMAKFELNQPQLSIKTGIPQSSISHYMNGTEPGFDKIGKMAQGLGLTISQFISLGEAAEPVAPPLSSVKLKIIEKIKLLDDTQVMALDGIIQSFSQAGAGVDYQPGRTKVKPGKRTAVVDEPEEIGIIELPGYPVKSEKK